MNNKNTICLNMIVKNESAIITRLFDSVINIIDSYCICDTGSTDNTIKLITEYFENKNISGKIIQEPFINFSHNRNVSLQGCNGLSDYILLMDADMTLNLKTFTKDDLLNGDVFYILQGTEDFYYYNIRIIKNDVSKYKYVCPTHEYLSYPNSSIVKHFNKNKIFINDIGDGGCKTDKFERDVKLLKNALLEEPTNARYLFYLANSYKNLKKYEKAITTYNKCILYEKYEDEKWQCYYSIGNIYDCLKNYELAIYNWLLAFEINPLRIENLYKIIRYYRMNEKYKLAYMFYNIAMKLVPHKKDNFLFLENDVYNYLLDYEYSIIAYYNGIPNINKTIVNLLNYNYDIYSNIKFYKNILNAKKHYDFTDSFYHEYNEIKHKMFSSSNSIIPYNDGYLMNVRYVNYYYNDNYKIVVDNNIITVNKMCILDKDFNIVNSKIFLNENNDKLYVGIEDVRIFQNSENNKIIGIGTIQKKDNNLGVGIITDYKTELDSHEIIELDCNFEKKNCEKNWVFFNYNNSLCVIYSWFPLQICEIKNDSLHLIETKKMPNIFKNCRGSTCGFEYNNEIWFIVHMVSYEHPRYYYELFVVFDKNMNLLRYSCPFNLSNCCIEYCLSIIVTDDEIIIPYSTKDCTTNISIYDKSYIYTFF
jgi:tetratricopeptide (TPR) repeat protein